MLIKVKKYTLLYIIIFILNSITLFAEIKTAPRYDLNRMTPDWVAVLGGNVLCSPIHTSYGYVALSEGKILSGFNNNGKVLWQRSYAYNVKPLLSLGPSDILYLVTDDSKVNMLNPGGLIVWSFDVSFSIIHKPLSGRDGRVFVVGTNNIACIGFNGIQRWTISTETLNPKLEPVELNDGSLLLFLLNQIGGKSVAIRLSPFGNVIEQIVFAGSITQAKSCIDGVLLVFGDGSAGLCSIKNQASVSSWTLSATEYGLSKSTAIESNTNSDSKALIISGAPTKAFIINTSNGRIENQFSISQINTAGLIDISFINQTIFISDSKNAVCYSLKGELIWEVQFSSLKKWNYLFATDNGYLAFCGTNWVIEAYRMKQNMQNVTENSLVGPIVEPYNEFYSHTTLQSSSLFGRALSEQQVSEIYTDFNQGNFGSKEEKWLPLLTNELMLLTSVPHNNFNNHFDDKSFFNTNISYAEEILKLIGSSGVIIYNDYLSTLITSNTDSSIQLLAVKAVGNNCYDEDGQILGAFEYLLHHAYRKNRILFEAICDSVFSICRCMGKPSFYDKGLNILSNLLYPQYDSSTRDYALMTIKKINELKL